MSYFSRIQLDETHPAARDALHRSLDANPYSDHQWLWQFFPAPDGTPRDFLFRRFDPQGAHTQPVFYVVSARPPQTVHEAWSVESRTYAPGLEKGARLSFDLRVNPVQSREREGKAKRDDVVMHAKKQAAKNAGVDSWAEIRDENRPLLYELVHEAILNWLCGADGLAGLAARHGFSVDIGRLRVDAYRQHRLPGKKQDIRFSTVDLVGELEVTDTSKFHKALLTGVGKAKAFGCGLLLVRRV